jgi:hypothetical protein
LREDGNFETDNLTEYTEKCFMGRKSKRRPQNSSVSSPHANSQVCAVRSTVQKCCVLGSMFAFVVLVAFACLSLLETHL